MTSELFSEVDSGDALDLSDGCFPIVGIGASAGGLEAFTQLLSHLPIDTGMAFVLIQHLAPYQKSLLTELLTKTTSMSVSEAQEGTIVSPNQVYIIPPNNKMTLVNGTLRLMPREKIRGTYLPIDAFFTSLARDCGHKAIAVVLSGGDGDGAQGIEAIKAAGGVTFAQGEGTAQNESMPNTAIATGHVDFVLPPEAIAAELAQLSRHSFVSAPPQTVTSLLESEEALSTLFALLQSSMGVDFTHYKPKTLDRRIQRRMLVYKLERLEDYVQYLQDDPTEVKALYDEILIHVTHFFRDPEAFEALKEQVFPVITCRKTDSPIRIWIPGCSTGEEVYSIVICLLEFLQGAGIMPQIQIFATDISQMAIDTARSGVYSESQMAGVSPERRNTFFFEVEGGYQITKSVRERCIFARQDLSRDPPFSRLDLISCRNVLIYLGEMLQKQVMPIFHHGLNPDGFLLLGMSESIGQFSDLFALENRKYKIYSKKLTATRSDFSFVTSSYPIVKGQTRQARSEQTIDAFDLLREADRITLERFAPSGVLINSHLDVLQIRGETSRYLRFAPGNASLNLLKIAREGLLVGLQAALYQAKSQNAVARKDGLRIESEDSSIVNIEVIPFRAPIANESYFLVLFEDVAPAIESVQVSPTRSEQGDFEREVMQLRQELEIANQERTIAQEYLQAIVQEHENVNQDLSIANEEILSSNEELQSTNEELETAKEEIQATNEELNTTNEELRSRNLALYQLNNDLTNLLAVINIPIVMLESDLRIRRFTPMAQSIFNLIATDIGRPFNNIRSNLDIPNLERSIVEVIDTLTVQEFELQTQDGHWYHLRIRPYRTIENQIDGAVLVLMDIDHLKRSATMLEAARNVAETANRAKDAFLSTVSHELRNPLSAILGYAQLLKSRKLDKSQITRALDVIERSAKAQSQLIEDLIDTAQITSGKIQLNSRSIDLSLLVEVAIANIQLSAEEKNVQITSRLNPVTVMGDVDRLNQVLWNLLGNAIKFTPSEGRVEVTLDVVDTQAQIRVTDTGRGIRTDVLPHIFERFRQGDNDTQFVQGLGLGLAIVHHFVDLHGGTVWAESLGEEQGTTLIVSLPLPTNN
jgi:two-component system, chemotaxis family, CheB/CheR fusion protein